MIPCSDKHIKHIKVGYDKHNICWQKKNKWWLYNVMRWLLQIESFHHTTQHDFNEAFISQPEFANWLFWLFKCIQHRFYVVKVKRSFSIMFHIVYANYVFGVFCLGNNRPIYLRLSMRSNYFQSTTTICWDLPKNV